MKSIKHIISSLENVDSNKALTEFLGSISIGGTYEWTGLFVFKTESPTTVHMEAFGGIPDSMKAYFLNHSEFNFGIQKQAMPRLINKSLLGESGNSSRCAALLVLPFNTKCSDYGYFVLGLAEYSFRVLDGQVEKLGWFWSIIVPYIYDAYQRITKTRKPHITKRELECMRWVSEGKTSWEISQILNISERTANFHVANYIEKTGSVNRQQAIAKCLLQGHLMIA
jgi:DNA-binding CsgD family transcriptional regulator